MKGKDTTIRVKMYTKELIVKHSRAKKMTQNDLVEQAILVAEKINFEYNLPLKEIEKKQVIQTNRLIGFLKIQDKNLKQTEENIYHFFNNRLKEDRREVLEYLSIKTVEEFARISDEYYGDKTEVKERFLDRFKEFFNEAYKTLLNDINTIK